jgi:hypothetical protein
VSDEHDLTLLRECGDPIEVSTLTSLLDGHGIKYVVQGEHHAGLTGGTFVLPRILVQVADLEAAQKLLASEPVIQGVEPDGSSLEGGLCPVHEQQAVAICGKCGTFLCASCNALGNPPLCEDCSKRDDAALAARSAATNRYRKGIVYIMVGAFALAAGYPLIRLLLRYLHLMR